MEHQCSCRCVLEPSGTLAARKLLISVGSSDIGSEINYEVIDANGKFILSAVFTVQEGCKFPCLLSLYIRLLTLCVLANNCTLL